MIYGSVVVVGALAYYAYKEYSLRAKKNTQNKTTPLSQTSGVFSDDVPINPSMFDIQVGGKNSTFENIKNSVSQIIEPFISTQKQNQLTGRGEFLDS
jgi:hypothetical protein